MRLRCGFLSMVVVTAALMVVTRSARASQTVYEGFSQSFPTYANGGLGFSNAWVVGGFNAFFGGYTANPLSLSYPSLEASTGGSVSGVAFPAINGSIRTLAQPLGGNSKVYVSFLIEPEGTLDEGIFSGFFGLTLNGNLGNDLFIGKPGGGAMEQYVVENRGGAGQVSSGTQVVVGRTALLVLKAEFKAGTDVFTLYTNPMPSRPEPSNGAVKADLDLGTVSKIGIYSTGAFTIDEIRIGTEYSDVVPKRGN